MQNRSALLRVASLSILASLLLISAPLAACSERNYDLFQKHVYTEDGVEYVDVSQRKETLRLIITQQVSVPSILISIFHIVLR